MHKHPTFDSTYFSCFWDVENPVFCNLEIFHRYTYAETDSRLLFQKWSKSVQDKCPKGIEKQKKTHFGTLRRNPWGNFPHFSCMSMHRGPSLIFQVSST